MARARFSRANRAMPSPLTPCAPPTPTPHHSPKEQRQRHHCHQPLRPRVGHGGRQVGGRLNWRDARPVGDYGRPSVHQHGGRHDLGLSAHLRVPGGRGGAALPGDGAGNGRGRGRRGRRGRRLQHGRGGGRVLGHAAGDDVQVERGTLVGVVGGGGGGGGGGGWRGAERFRRDPARAPGIARGRGRDATTTRAGVAPPAAGALSSLTRPGVGGRAAIGGARRNGAPNPVVRRTQRLRDAQTLSPLRARRPGQTAPRPRQGAARVAPWRVWQVERRAWGGAPDWGI